MLSTIDTFSLDIEALLSPIPGFPNGAGVDGRPDYRVESLFHLIRGARAEARAKERESQYDPDAYLRTRIPDEWNLVATRSVEYLRTVGKGFDVASYLADSLARLGGISGFAAGIDLIERMIDAYWEDGYPNPADDEDAIDDRMFAVVGLFGEASLGTSLRHLWLRAIYQGPLGPVTLHDLCRALKMPVLDEIGPMLPEVQNADVDLRSSAARTSIIALREDAVRLRASCLSLQNQLLTRIAEATLCISDRATLLVDTIEDVANATCAADLS